VTSVTAARALDSGVRPVINESTGTRAEWYDEVARAQWQPIVDEDVWRRTVLRLRSNMEPALRGRTGPTPRHLLSGIALCGICGSHVTSSVGGKDTNWAQTYRCSSKRHLVRRAQHIEEFVHVLVVHRLSRPDAVDLLTRPAEKAHIDNVLAEMATVRDRLRNLAVHFADGFIDRDQMRAGTERGRLRLAELNRRSPQPAILTGSRRSSPRATSRKSRPDGTHSPCPRSAP
jgi:site-specific DNA recombinase